MAFDLVSSGWQDSNLRPPAPKAGAIPGYATSRFCYWECKSTFFRQSNKFFLNKNLIRKKIDGFDFKIATKYAELQLLNCNLLYIILKNILELNCQKVSLLY